MIQVSTAQIRLLERQLTTLRRHGIPISGVNTLNNMAFDTMRAARQELPNRMILRNQWTIRSISVLKATFQREQSEVGSTEKYMLKQELGGFKRAGAGKKVSIATSRSTGESKEIMPRKKVVKPRNRLSRIKLKERDIRARSKKGRAVAAVKQAISYGDEFVFLDLQKSRGIFRLAGRNPNKELELIQDQSRDFAAVPANPWLSPVSQRVSGELSKYYIAELLKQIDRAIR